MHHHVGETLLYVSHHASSVLQVFQGQISHIPLEDQTPSHKCTSAECLHHVAVTCLDEQRVQLYGMLSLQQQR